MLAISWAQMPPRGANSSGLISQAGSAGLGSEMRGWSSGGASLMGGPLPARVPEEGPSDDSRRSWQLLTGHDNGQLLVWNAAADRLVPACKLGEPGSAVRGAASLDAWGLVCTAHANGEIALFSRPAQASDWGGGALSGALSSAASHALASASSSTHSSCAGAVGGLPASATPVGIACVRPRRLVLRAHRGGITAAGGSSSGLVTASSQGTLRLWRAADLAREADKAGLVLGGSLGRRTTAAATLSATERWVGPLGPMVLSTCHLSCQHLGLDWIMFECWFAYCPSRCPSA